jgi:hypothetical protein
MGDRPDISMSAEEVRAFLASQTRVVVAALDGGAPVGTVADVRVVDAGIEVTLAADDPVRLALAVDARVCAIAEQFPGYEQIKGVCVHGRAAPVDGVGGVRFRLGLGDVTSFDFAKLPRVGVEPGHGHRPRGASG